MIKDFNKGFGKWTVGIIVGLIAFVFVFAGIFTPGGTNSASMAGSVNGEAISMTDYGRALNRRLEVLKNYGFKEDQIKSLGVYNSVFQELVTRKLVIQHAEKMGIKPSEAAIRETIGQYEAFKKDGRFDVLQYHNVLKANSMTPASFERQVAEDIQFRKWQQYFQNAAMVSETEVKQEYVLQSEKRKLKYVLISTEKLLAAIKVTSAEIAEYLKDEKNLNLAQSRYEALKTTKYKGKTLEQAQNIIAKEVLQSRKKDEASKTGDELSEKVIALMSQGSDSAINSALRAYDVKVEKTDWITLKQKSIPNLGSVHSLQNDLFSKEGIKSPKKYSVPKGIVVAVAIDRESKLASSLTDTDRIRIRRELLVEKERAMTDDWLKKTTQKAEEDGDIQKNPQLEKYFS